LLTLAKPYTRITTFNSPQYTVTHARCQICDNPIIEAIRKIEPPRPRVECYECLARWWANSYYTRHQQPSKETQRDARVP
jgi:hypothetical protein